MQKIAPTAQIHTVFHAILLVNVHHAKQVISPTQTLASSNVSVVQKVVCCVAVQFHAASVKVKDSTWSKATVGLANLAVPNVLMTDHVLNVMISTSQ